jgi:hypothetical protein
MALGSTQPLTDMRTKNLLGGKGRPTRKAHNLTVICEPIVWKMWEPRRLTTQWAFIACYRDSFTLEIYYIHRISKDNLHMDGMYIDTYGPIFEILYGPYAREQHAHPQS